MQLLLVAVAETLDVLMLVADLLMLVADVLTLVADVLTLVADVLTLVADAKLMLAADAVDVCSTAAFEADLAAWLHEFMVCSPVADAKALVLLFRHVAATKHPLLTDQTQCDVVESLSK